MRRWIALLLLFVGGSLQAQPSVPPASTMPSAVLRWRNGESVAGALGEASASEVNWETALFDEPLLLRWEAVRRIDQPQGGGVVHEPFSFVLRDGSHLYGEPLAITADTVRVKSARHGEVELARSAVLSIRRLRSETLRAAGPNGRAGWDTLENRGKKPGTPPAIPPIVSAPGGVLALPYSATTVFYDVELPQLLDAEFRVRASHRPQFQFSLEAAPTQRLRVETWDNELVLAAGDSFKAIRVLSDDEREVAVRLCWNRETRKCTVFTPAGELLTEWEVPESPEGSKGSLVLQNRGGDLALEFLRVRQWNGNPPPKVDLAQPRVEFADGRVVAASVLELSEGKVSLVGDELGAEASFPWSDIDALVLSADRPQIPADATELTFADGTLLFGAVSGLKDGSATMAVSFAREPFVVRLDSLTRLMNRAPTPAGQFTRASLAEHDKLMIGDTQLRGKVITATGDAAPRWLPIGGVKPVRVPTGQVAEFIRTFPRGAEFPRAEALVHTKAGDILPGELRALSREGVELTSALTEQTKFPAASMAALQFGAAQPADKRGLESPEWRVLRGKEKEIKRGDDSLSMEAGAAVGNANALRSSELSFTVDGKNQFNVLRLRMFCAGVEPSPSVSLILAAFGNSFYAGLEAREGQMEDRTDTPIVPGKPVAVRLVFSEKEVELHVNGSPVEKFAIDPKSRKGTGLILEPASLWGNAIRPVELTDFSLAGVIGAAPLPGVPEETRRQALTVPRFRRDDLPPHALLGTNGDLIRGEIEAMTSTHFAFRAGLESLRIPRERVSAAVWLKKPEAEPPRPVVEAAETPLEKLLQVKIKRRISYASAQLANLLEVITRQTPELKIQHPGTDGSVAAAGLSFAGKTNREALETIARSFALKMRLVEPDTVVLEAQSAPSDLVTRAYWLRPDAFPQPARRRRSSRGRGFLSQKVGAPPGMLTHSSWSSQTRSRTWRC
jgi:hypothetical protein